MIFLEGATQLFRIKALCQDNNEVFKFYNKFWVRSDDKDKTKNIKNVEDGC